MNIAAALKRFLKPSNRSLIRELVISDFKLRYQNSFLGYLWSLLRPLMLFGILYVIFTTVVKAGKIPHYPQYLLLGIVLWTFFVESTVAGMNAIVGRGDLMRKVSIPKYTVIVSTTLTAFLTFCLNMIIVVIFMLFGRVPFRWNLIFLPFLLAELVMFCMAVSFLLSTLYVKLRDFSHIWDIFLQTMFYATPIIYVLGNTADPSAGIPHKFAVLASLNPLAQIFQDIRSIMITPQAYTTTLVFHSQLARVIPVIAIIVLFIVSALYFRRNSKNFAEEL